MSVTTSEWRCSSESCGRDLPDAHVGGDPCPYCGHVGRVADVEITESIEVLSSLRLEKKSPGYPSRRRVRVDDFQGFEKRGSDGCVVKKTRRIDRDANTYFEHVEDRAGNVIRHCEEPLSDHQGRGTAKLKKD